MVLNFYNLAEQPFGVTPNPRFLYFGKAHREAAASLQYGLDSRRGFTALVAHPGMGKTTLLFEFLGRMRESSRTVFLFQPQPTPRDLLRSILDDLGDSSSSTDLVRMIRTLNELLMQEAQRGRRVVVVIDEAQTFSDTVLEAVRMLSNFETPGEKLMHVILSGQPQLAEKLASKSLVQLRQRISIVSRLMPFDLQETGTYIDHRLRVAGYDFAQPLFSRQALALIHNYSEGVPRNINNLCFSAMSIGSVLKQKTIGAEVIEEVISDLDLRPLLPTATAAVPVAAASAPVRVAPAVSATVPPQRPAPVVERPWSFSVPTSAPRRTRTWRPRFSLVAIALLSVVTAGMLLKFNGQSTRAEAVRRTSAPIQTVPAEHSSAKPAEQNVAEQPTASQPTANSGNEFSTGDAAKDITTKIENVAATTSDASSVRKAEEKVSGGTPAPIRITVSSKGTLFSICMEYYGSYDPELIERIKALNPEMKDPRHLKVGQILLLPSDDEFMWTEAAKVQPVSKVKMTGRSSQ